MNRLTKKKKIYILKQSNPRPNNKNKLKSEDQSKYYKGGFNKSNIAKAAVAATGVAATGVAAATYVASHPEVQETLQHFKDKIIDNITQSSLSNLFSSYAYIFSPFGSSDIFLNAKINKFESKFLTPCQDKDYFYNDVKKSDWDFSIQGLKNKFVSFLNELKNNNLTYSRKDISRLSRIQKISNISQIYSLNESIEDYLQTIQLDNLNTSQISELVKSFYPDYAQQEFEINTKYWICLQSKHNNLLFIPVIIKRHLFSYYGIYLNSLKNAFKIINQSNLQNLDDPYPIEFPYYNFIMDLPSEVKINCLLVPCYSSIPNKVTNLSNIQDLISEIDNDNSYSFLDNSDLDTLEKVQTSLKEDIKITQSIQYISQHPEIFEKKSFDDHQSFLQSPPFLIENLLDLFLAPSWIDKYVVNRCYNFWIQFQFKKLINISDFHQIKELNSGLSNISKISPDEIDQLKITDLDIVPCIWTNSKTFQHLITTVLVGLAATTLLNKTETGKTIKNKVLKPVVNQVKEYISPIQPVSTDISIPKKEGLFKRTMKKIKDFSPFKKFMSKGGKKKTRYHTLKIKREKVKK